MSSIAGGAAIRVGMGAAGRAAPSLGRLALRRLRLMGVVDPALLNVDELSLNANEATDVRGFLSSEPTRALIEITATCLLASPDDRDAIGALGRAFRDAGRRWRVDRQSEWDVDILTLVWEGLLKTLDLHLPESQDLEGFKDELEQLSSFVRSPLDLEPERDAKSDFVARLIELSGNLSLIQDAALVASRVTNAWISGKLPPIITHADVDVPADFDKLYVPRTLVRAADGYEQDSLRVVSGGRGFRIVLLGNPGAGKTTFVRHATWHFATRAADQQGSQVPLVVRCRDYAGNAWASSLIDFLLGRIKSELGVDSASKAALENGLLLGKYIVVLDGLDEVTELAKRTELVQRIERFASTYPVTSMLATSREVGYGRAPLSPALFGEHQLREFSEEQVRSYAERWFTLRERPDLIEPFMAESATVIDLRSNPLLLSLLCILFRARAVIPRQRRDVYARCADLLFHTWDAQRQIHQPEEIPKYGDKLMQEVAHWVYKSSAAQGGIEERAIRKVIANQLESFGILPGEARRRGDEFIDFCAGRAWLLGPIGSTKSDERLFGFTHRTFYEYFAAEALSRSVKSTQDLCDHMEKAYDSDSTSVLPELLLQAYDHRVEDGAKSAFQLMTGRAADPALLLRLMNGALLPTYVRSGAFEQIVRLWRAAPSGFDHTGFDALFSLDSNALGQFESRFMQADPPDAANLFARGWASITFRGRDKAVAPEWHALADGVASMLVERDLFDDDYSVWNWLALDGFLRPGSDLEPYLAINVGGAIRAGAIWRSVLSGLGWGSRRSGAHNLTTAWLNWIADEGRQVHWSIASGVGFDVTHRGARDAQAFSSLAPARGRFTSAQVAAVTLGLLFEEVENRPDWLLVPCEGSLDPVGDLAAVRRWRKGEAEEPARAVKHSVVTATRLLPAWVRMWVDGRRNLVAGRSDFDQAFSAKQWSPGFIDNYAAYLNSQRLPWRGRAPRPGTGGPRSGGLGPTQSRN